jgi:aldose sugar dehydrogenase
MNMNRPVYIVIYLVIAVMLLSPTYVSITGQQSGSNDTGINDNNHLAKYRRIIELDPVGGNSSFNSNRTDSKTNEHLKRDYLSLDNQSGLDIIGLPALWNDPWGKCETVFTCGINSTDGWDDKQSFQLSTTNNTNNTWSTIRGREIDVKPGELVQLVSHMKLNDWATDSHVVYQVFNETSNQWYQIKQCPSGLSGYMEWREFSCFITIPENTTKMRPELNAGWSSQPNKKGTTLFDSVSMITERKTWFDSVSMINHTTRFDSVSMIKDAPFVTDPNLKVEVVYEGLEHPTSMAFLGKDDILVLEKNNGTVKRIVNGTTLSKPLLDVPVASKGERGMLGIAIARHETDHRVYVFLYYTESATGRDGDGDGPRNRLYRYEFINNTLVEPKLLLDLPAGFYHNGGKILIGPDKYLYITIGELDRTSPAPERNKALNNQSRDANEPDERGGILRIDQNGQPIGTHGILGDEEPLNKYYAYGIRNSFGMDFDPLTGKLWDTENGPYFGDEINLVEPGFNSGWREVQGIWTVADGKIGVEDKGALASEKPRNLVDFNGKGNYSSPEFTWSKTVGPTELKFLSNDKLGKKYENDMLVADVSYGRIYHFKLNQNRTELLLQNPLSDKVANNNNQLSDVLFAQGFDSGRDQSELAITDMEIGPDGYLYVLVHGEGKIFRIVPK